MNNKNGAVNLITLSVILLSCTYFLEHADIFQKFMPRAFCMFHNERLIQLHIVTDTIIFISYTVIAWILMYIYKKLRTSGLPYYSFTWQFGGFIFFCGLTHLVAVINIFVTFYWLDGLIKLITAWFSLLTMISLLRSFKSIGRLKTPREFEDLANRYNELLESLFKKQK